MRTAILALLVFTGAAQAQSTFPRFIEPRQAFPTSRDALAPVLMTTLFDQDGDRDLDCVWFQQSGPFDSFGTFAIQDGSGFFQSAMPALPTIPGLVHDVAAFDADSDMDADLAIAIHLANSTSEVHLWISPSGSVMLHTHTLPIPTEVTALTAGDVDGDGDADLVVVTNGGSQAWVRLYRNDGAANFVEDPSATPRTAIQAQDVELGDLDGDFDLDIYVANAPIDHFYRNDGRGNFVNVTSQLPQTSSMGVQIFDAEGDGDNDVFLIASTGTATQFVNDGSGRFSFGPFQPAFVPQPTFVRSGDFDGDGDIDAMIGQNRQPVTYVATNQGGLRYVQRSLPLFGLEGDPRSTQIGDLDGDGDLDIVRVDASRPSLWLNDGTALWKMADDSFPVTWRGRAGRVKLAHMDADRNLDLVSIEPSNIRISRAVAGPGRFDDTNVRILSSIEPIVDALLFDADADQDLDVLAITQSNAGGPSLDRLWINMGAGVFIDRTTTQMPFVPTTPSAIAIADLDADGDLDPWIGMVDGSHAIYWNDGTGVFTMQANVLQAGTNALRVLLEDLDGDGDTDAVFLTASRNEVWLNLGSSVYQHAPFALPMTAQPSPDGALADVDGDSDLDLIVVNSGPGTSGSAANALYRNDGRGHFTQAPGSVFPGFEDATFAIAVADFDGNGWPDVYCGNVRVPNLTVDSYVLANDGTAFHRQDVLPVSSWHVASATAGDLDGDRDIDLAVAYEYPARRIRLIANASRATRAPLPPRLGRTYRLEVFGPPGSPFAIGASLRGADFDLGPLGRFLLDPTASFFILVSGWVVTRDPIVTTGTIPNFPGLVGRELHWQSVFAIAPGLSNAVAETISNL